MVILASVKKSQAERSEKQTMITFSGYASLLLGLLHPSVFIFSLIWILLCKSSNDSLLKAHYHYIFKTVICSLYLATLAALLTHSFNSKLFFIPVVSWFLYRIIKGGLLSLLNVAPCPIKRA